MPSNQDFLRPVASSDLKQIWIWANDPQVRENSFNPQAISWEDHCRWFQKLMVNPNWKGYIGIDNLRPIGIIRFQIHSGEANIGINISAEARGKGWGKKMIQHGCALFFSESQVTLIHALIKPENIISLRVFRAAGFHETTTNSLFPFAHRHLILSRPK